MVTYTTTRQNKNTKAGIITKSLLSKPAQCSRKVRYIARPVSSETIKAIRMETPSWIELFIIRRKFGEIISIVPANSINDLRVALIQTDIHWEDIHANLKMLDDKISTIVSYVDLIVLPEMFSTGFSMTPDRLAEGMDGSAIDWLRKVAVERNCVVTGSLMLYDMSGGEKKYYNRIVWMKPDGLYEVYDKRHLFSLSDEPKCYTAGDKRLIQNIHGWNICPMICYDLRFPVWSRNAINDRRETSYDVLVYVANWPDRRGVAWRTLLQARAIENQCYVIGVNRVGKEGDSINYSGDSSAIDPLGNILYRKEHEEDIAIVHLNYEEMIKVRRQLSFLKDADRFELR